MSFIHGLGIDITKKINFVSTLFFTVFPIVITYLYPYAKKIFALLGNFFATSLIVLFPGLLWMKLNQEKTQKRNLIKLWTISFTTLGYISGGYILYNDFFN